MYPGYRLHDANIALVCWPECHKAIDSMILWHKTRIQQLLELWTSFTIKSKCDMTKYNAKKVVVDWFTFDSKVEAEYYSYLKTKKDIMYINTQPSYILQQKHITKKWETLQPIKYIADFEVIYNNWICEVIDIKWMATPEAKIKRKMFLYTKSHLTLKWLVKYKWERVDYFDNEKRKKDNKKKSKNLLK